MYLYYLLHLTYKVIDSEKNAAANLFVRSTEFALFLQGLEKYCLAMVHSRRGKKNRNKPPNPSFPSLSHLPSQ